MAVTLAAKSSNVTTSYKVLSDMIFATSAACMAWPARSAITCPSNGLSKQSQIADQIQRFMPDSIRRRSAAHPDSTLRRSE